MVGINEITISKLQEMLQTKKISVKETVQEYISRMKQYDQGNDGLNSVIEINPEALEIAEELDQKGNNNQLLYGVPILMKDNIDTADQMHTSAGSLALAQSYAKEDATLVKSLRAKGAILLGKTNMTEFANYMTDNMPNGYSSRGGQVKNPYHREKDPSGSSSGSAVAVAANLCTASIGSDTCNSIIGPGIANGIVGFRPATGAISQKGIIPISFTLDTAGPFTRTVEDASIMYSGLTNKAVVKDQKENIKGKIVGFNEWIAHDQSEEIVEKTQEAVRELEKAGAVIKILKLPKTDYIMDVMKYEFKYAMNQYLKNLPVGYPIRTLKDIIEYNRLNSERTLRYGQSLLLDAEINTSGVMKEEDYVKIMTDRKESIIKIHNQMKDCDLCIMLSYNNILQYTEMPCITIPCGLQEDGMPKVIYMTAGSDEKLLSNAYIVERTIGCRVEPKLM